MGKADLVLDARAVLGEGPYWDVRDSRLYWIDIRGESLHAFDPVSGRDRRIELGRKPGAVVGRESGGFVIALADGFSFIDPSTGGIEGILDPEVDKPDNRFNDGKCDSRGRFWAGTMSDSEKGRTGSLYRLDTDLSCSRVLEGIGISNGIAWSPDDRTMYYIDTPNGRVDAFDFDAEEGSIRGRRTAFEVPRSLGHPDGMTIDEEGMLWVALWEGWAVGRWDPRKGALIDRVEVPVARVTSCAFGGPRLDILYITTARWGVAPEEEAHQASAGGLFSYEPGLRGAASRPFAG